MDKIYYTIYKVTNKLNGKIYIGSHKTKKLDDGYMGSGKYLTRAIKKEGIENFIKEILFIFETPEEMYSKEAELVNEEFLEMQNTYNLKVGGFGGWDFINSDLAKADSQRKKARKVMVAKLIELYGVDNPMKIPQVSDKLGLKISGMWKLGLIQQHPNSKTSFSGKTHSLESKIKIGQSSKISQLGNKNSQYETRWIFNLDLKKSMKIKCSEPIPEGWVIGRKMFKVD